MHGIYFRVNIKIENDKEEQFRSIRPALLCRYIKLLGSVSTEEAPVKISDSREGLVADKRGVNSSVSLSLRGARMTDHQRLKGYKAIKLDVTVLASV